MFEKCLIAASLAALVCHPSFTIRCINPKCNEENNNTKKVRPRKPEKKQTLSSKQVSQIFEDEWPVATVKSTFLSGWPFKPRVIIEKILKVNHSEEILNKFEEYREGVKSKYGNKKSYGSGKKYNKLMADGNELVRFHGSVIECSLGTKKGPSGTCQDRLCEVCRAVSSGFPSKGDCLPLYESSWRAHENINREGLVPKSKVAARTAVVICRVIAGRIANWNELEDTDAEERGFDSVVSWNQSTSSKELVILNSRAILPCFVVIYKVKRSW